LHFRLTDAVQLPRGRDPLNWAVAVEPVIGTTTTVGLKRTMVLESK
jgi:hypothetical protein